MAGVCTIAFGWAILDQGTIWIERELVREQYEL